MNGHLKRVLILLLIFTFVFQMAGVTSLSHVQAYAETEEAVLDISDADEAEDMTTEENDTESPGEIETDGENPPDEAAEPAAPEAASEEPAEVPEETPAEETITVEEPAEEPAPAKAPVLKAATKAEKTGTVLAFTSDTHNKEGNTAAKRLGDWVEMVENKHGDIDVMAFGGDMAGAGASGYWDLTQADFNMLESKGVPGVYTTGNHEISMGGDFKYSLYIANSYLPTETKGQFVIDEEVAVGDDYRIYCLGSRSDSQAYPEDQRNALDDYLTNVGNDKVIFIITHFPLHYYGSGYSRSTTGASEMIELLNNAVTNNGQTIVFLWGHNHTLSDTYYDQIYGPGGVDSIQYSSSSSSKKTIKFYYGGAGCMSDIENGGGSEFVKGKGLVATITPAGENSTLAFKYYNEGGTDVTESNSVKSVNVEITEPVPATGVTIDEAAAIEDDGQATGASIAAGKTLKLHLTLEPKGASSSGVTWSSSDESVATVSNSGLVTAKKEGTAVITAAIPSGTRAAGPTSSIEITVTAAPKEVSITPASSSSPTENATIEVGETLTINVTNGSSSAYNYTATLSDSGVAEIQGEATVNITGSGTGQFAVKGLTAGTVDITIQNNGQFSNRKGTIHLTVSDSGGDDPVVPEPGDGDKYYEVSSFSAGKEYVIGALNGDNSIYAIKNGGGSNVGSQALNVTAESGTESAYVVTSDSTLSWTRNEGDTLEINNTFIYPGSDGNVRAYGSSGRAISFTSDGKLTFISSNTTYYITWNGTSFGTSNNSANAATFRIFEKVEEGSGDDPTPTQGDRYVPATNFTADKDYIVAVDKGNGKVDVLKNAGSGSLGSVELTVGTENGTDYVTTADTSVIWKYTTNTRNRISNSSRYLTINGTSKALETDTTGNYAITYNSSSKIELTYPGGSSGNIYYVKYSNGTFSATGANASGDAATIRLFVKDEGSVPVTGVSLNKNTLALEAGESETLSATVQPTDATNKAVTWSSSNGSVATVDNGTVTAVGAGEATITVTTADGGKTAACTVTVTEPELTRYVEVNELKEGKNYIVAVTKDANTVYVIRNNNGSLASAELAVTKNGNEAAYVETGNASVVWKFNGGTDNLLSNQASYYLNITNSGNARDLYISTTTAYGVGYTNSHLYLRYFSESTSEYYVLCNNGTFSAGAKNDSSNAATIRLFEEYTTPVDPGTETRYELVDSLENGGEYLIVNSNSGSAYALKNPGTGVANIANANYKTAVTVENDGYIMTSDTDIVWTAEASGAGFHLSNGGLYLEGSGGNTGIFSTLNNSDRSWTYSDAKQLQMPGGNNSTYTLRYSSSNSYFQGSSSTSSNSYVVYLFKKAGTDPVTGVTLSPATLDLETGETATLTATVQPTSAGNKSVTWSSSNESVATVNANGVVTAVGAGNATITVTTVDGSKTATCEVTVTAPVTVDYVLATKLEVGRDYLIANGNTGSVYIVSNEAGGSRQLKGVAATVTNDKISITEAIASNTAFTVELEDESNSDSTLLKNGSQYLYADSSNGLRMYTWSSSANGKHWHYKADDKNLLWFFKDSDDTNNTLGYNHTGNTYKYYLTCTDGIFTDAYVSGNNTLANTTTPAIYLFVKDDGIVPHTHTYGEPVWTWAEGNTSATASFTCTEGDDTQTVTDSAPVETVVTAAGCETNKVVKYTATVTFNGEQYTNNTDNITVPDSALGHAYGEPAWTWDGFTAATATFTCANDASHTQTVNATITSAAQGGVTTYTATATFEGQTYTAQKTDDSKLITSASATFTYPIVGDDVTMGRNATVPEGANYSVYVYEYRDANGTKLTSGTFEAGKTYYAEYTFDANPGYGFKGGAADTSGQVPAPEDRVALTINGTDATSLIDTAYTFSRVSVYVQFTPGNPEFNLTISTYGVSGADGTATLSATRAHRGDEITVTATPAAGSAFEYAEYKRAGSQENATRINNGKFNMPPYDVEVTAVFTKAKYTIAVTSNNEAYGTASISEPQSWYNMGDEVTLTATAKDGYEFSRWNVISGGVTIANDKFTVGTENVEIQAVFAPKNYSLKFYANEGDTDTYAVVTKAFGDTITEVDLPAAPTKAFYTFNGWTPEIPATMPAEDKTFNATWTAKEAYYLVGSMNNWTVSETYEFVASPQNPGEYTVAATLTANDEIKVVKAVAGVKDESNYYPSTEHPGASGQTGNYIVDQYHAGGVTVYFRPAGNTDEGWQDFGGYFYIEGDHAVTVETSPANSGTAQVVRGDGSGAATSAPKGMSLTVNATPADNYQLDKIEIWKTNGGTEAEETLEGNTFNMPDYDVTVKVYFKVVNWTFVDFTWEQTTDGYKAVANYTGNDGSTKTVNAEVTAETTEATCEEAGETVYSATIVAGVSLDGEAHNATKTVVIPAAGHTYGDLIAEVPATCTTDGVKAHYECSVCHKLFNADKTETTAEALKIAATGHDWSYKNFTWTGDEETGYTAATVHYVCRNDADHTRAINVTVTSETNAPTCENTGSTVYTATVAAADSPDGIGHTDTRTVVIPATGHSWKFVNFTWTGNDEEGYTAAAANYKCENDEEHTQTVNATVTSDTTAASCEVAGSTVYTATVAAADSLDGKVCTETKTVEIPATGHKWVKPAEWTWIGDDESGYTGIRGTFTCENDPEHTREVQSTEEVTVKRVEPTATQAGSITYTVNVTGPNGVVYEVEKEIIIPPAGYTFKDPVYTWTKTTDGYSVAALKECNEDPAQNITETVTATYAVTTPATCKAGGVGTYTAAFAKSDFTTQTKPEDIPATGHTPVTDAAVAPTCTETGLTEGSHCSVCGDILTAQETVPALGHDWRQPTEVWNSDHTSVVLTFVCNRDAKHTETVTASGSAITSEVTTEPTATTPGVRTYTATVTFDGKTYTLSDTEVIPVTGSSVSGNITSFVGNNAEGQVTVQLFAAGSETAAYTATVTGNTSYAFAGVANGTYTMKVSKKDHATRSYEITVAGGAVTQDVKIHLLGDINGDGDITTVDAARVNAHAKGSTLLTDYNFACGDINGDGDITTVDAARTNAHAKGATLIW